MKVIAQNRADTPLRFAGLYDAKFILREIILKRGNLLKTGVAYYSRYGKNSRSYSSRADLSVRFAI
jgi:hypothetical protein